MSTKSTPVYAVVCCCVFYSPQFPHLGVISTTVVALKKDKEKAEKIRDKKNLELDKLGIPPENQFYRVEEYILE